MRLSSILAVLALAAGAGSAWAQNDAQQSRPVVTSNERGNTVRIFITGTLELDYVYRGHSVTSFTDSFSNPDGGANRPAAIANSDSEDTFEGQWGVRFTAELSNRVTAVVEVGTLRVNNSPDAVTGTGNDQDGIRRFGVDEAPPVDLREAHLLVTDLFAPGLQLQFGITTWAFNPRGSGGSLAFDPRRSQTINRNLDSDGTFETRDNGDDRLFEAAFVDEVMPVGGVLTYNRESLQFDLVILPGVIEGGSSRNDESLYAADVILRLDSLGGGSQIGLIVAQQNTRTASGAGTDDAHFWTFGTGGVLKLAGGAFEVFAEGYLQRGKVGQQAADSGDIKAHGTAGTVGLQYNHTVGNPMPVWMGLSFTHFSGEGDDDANSHSADRFAGYESLNDLLVIEDSYFGYDWDSNIQVIKIWLGARMSTAQKDDLELGLILGIAEAEERVNVPGGGTKDDLGNEVDVRVRWHVSKQASLYVSAGFLFGSEILRETVDQFGNDDVTSNAQVVVVGTAIKF